MTAHLSGRAGRPTAQAPAGLGDAATIPCADCVNGVFPMYGVAPHECYWRKGPKFTIGNSTLIPFGDEACFVPDLEADEDWSAFVYPSACGIFYCPQCQRDKYIAAWNALIGRIGPPANAATPATPLLYKNNALYTGFARSPAGAIALNQSSERIGG